MKRTRWKAAEESGDSRKSAPTNASCQSKARKVRCSLRLGKATPSQAERKGNSNSAATWNVLNPCLSLCQASPLEPGKFCQELRKSAAQCPCSVEPWRPRRGDSLTNMTQKMNGIGQESGSHIYQLLHGYTNYSLVDCENWLVPKAGSTNPSVGGQTANALGLRAPGSPWQLSTLLLIQPVDDRRQ